MNTLLKKVKEWSDQKVEAPQEGSKEVAKPEGWVGWTVSGISTISGRNSATSKTDSIPNSPLPVSAKPQNPNMKSPLSSLHPPLIPVAMETKSKGGMTLSQESKQKIVIPLEDDNNWGSKWDEDPIFETPHEIITPKANVNTAQSSGWDDKWSPERTNAKKEDVLEDWT